MPGDTSSGAADLVFCLLLIFPSSSPFTQKKESVCHSSLDCGRARLTCDAGQRLAVLHVSRGYHLNVTSHFDQCPSSVQNCSAIPENCCRPDLKAPLVCREDYSSVVVAEASSNCSAQVSGSAGRDDTGDNVTCVLDLPADPQLSKGKCSQLSAYHSRSSYSLVDYACIEESDVVPFCEASQRRGNLLYTFWTPSDTHRYLNDVNVTSCQCSVTADAGVFVRALDVRIPASDDAGRCSYVTITDSVTTRLNTTCLSETTILFGETSQQTQSRPPVDVILSLDRERAPAVVWIGFQGLESHDLTLTCFNAGENVSRESPQTQKPISTSDSSSVSIPAVIGGTVAGLVLLVVISFICFYFVSKRRKQSFKRRKPPTWWERTREEDRIAEMSQFGPASAVNVDRGRYMAYGANPPTRRCFPTSDTNPPIYIVPGSAVPPNNSPSDFAAGDVADDVPRDSWSDLYSNGQHPGTRATGGAVSNMAGLSLGLGLGPEPSVHYVVPRDGGGGGEEGEPQSVVVVNDGSKVRVYEIPPLTIKELDE
ncbi:uncharacterized protein LOC143279787 [Babylonia areolata]|uniref:uncharacterized protein LOC143279787 n=1 Tax=Babylonia areolata TaxID=304850 RepID=UPI003FD69236